MKKIVSLILILALSVFVLAACGNNDKDDDNTVKENDYTLAIGVAVTESRASAKITYTVAGIVTDKDGKIVLCKIDSVDFTAKLGDDGKITASSPVSKGESGDSYFMDYATQTNFWYEHEAAFSKYVVGKTQAEVAGIALADTGKTDLIAGCTIDIRDFLKAVDNAFKSEHKTAFKSEDKITLGLGVNSTLADSTKDEILKAKCTSDFAAVVMLDGKVVANILDTAEATLTLAVDAETSKLTTTDCNYSATKRAQGDSYSMPSGAWYKQADAYSVSANGKTVSELASLATEGVAGCTMQNTVGGYKIVIEKGAKNA